MELSLDVFQKIRTWASQLKAEIVVTAHAVGDARTPWYARALGWLIIAYALSPIDLIPDFIPVLGLVDDLLLLPIGLWLLRCLIPPDVLLEYQSRRDQLSGFGVSLTGAILVAGAWIAIATAIGAVIWRASRENWIFAGSSPR